MILKRMETFYTFQVLRINQAAVNNTAEGHVTNLIGNDVARFDFVALFFHYIWIMPLQVTTYNQRLNNVNSNRIMSIKFTSIQEI